MWTVSIESASKRYLEVAKTLLKAKPKSALDLKNRDSYTALMQAAETGQLALVQALLEAGAAVDSQSDYNGYTALMSAAETGRLDIVQALLEAGAALDFQNSRGYTALIFSASRGHLNIVQALLEAGAAVDLQHSDGCTALMQAARNGHLNIVQALLEAGAHLNLINLFILHVRYLKYFPFPFKSNLNNKNIFNFLTHALERNDDQAACVLLKRFSVIDLNDNTIDFRSLLFMVARNSHPSTLDLLIYRSAQWRFLSVIKRDTIDRVDGEGKTALHHAIEAGNIDMIRHLRQKYRASTNITDKSGKTPIELAAYSNKGEITDILNEPIRLSVLEYTLQFPVKIVVSLKKMVYRQADDRSAGQKSSDSQDESVQEGVDSGATSVDPINPVQYQLLRYSSQKTLGDLASSAVQSIAERDDSKPFI